jgi:hypothetical protein
MFQTKCKNLEDLLNRNEEESSDTIRKLRRDLQLLEDQQTSSKKAIHDL